MRKDLYEEEIKMYEIAKAFEWDKWREETPNIPMQTGWNMRPIAPFGGAVARVIIGHIDNKDVRVSVYLDCYDRLGYEGKPYWEVYPVEGDCARHFIDDVDGLVASIQQSINEQMNKKD